ncbi:hypothetical protein G9C98_005979 [Cotesia typhae]|uniref:Hexosyltransferase n=1 Tax=Cotesia typhae TaxID=2053667 RepID=A0A8J5QNX9_9HYME|nr:hypothetical protein G9C98_005979 [Cotesia typhae]
MLDKRRLHGHVSSPGYSLFVVALLLMGFLSFWMLIIGCPQSTLLTTEVTVPGYILLVPDNVSTIPVPYSLNDLPSSDESTLIDIKNFKFTINHDPCNKTQPLLLMLIHSAPGNFAKRNVVRDTWGKQTPEMIVLFLVGATLDYQADLNKENNNYQDIIQGNFIDAYRNMTYKHVMALKWATYHCPNSVFLLYKEAQREPYFWIDDVHITGTVARKVNLTHSSLHSLVLKNEDMQELLSNPNVHREFLFGPPNLAENHIKALHYLSQASKVWQ